MEWVRKRAKSEFRGDDGITWNQGVMKGIGIGPKPPQEEDENGNRRHVTPEEAKAYAAQAAHRMSITCGYRTGYIARGPQGEAPMLRAAPRAPRGHVQR